jgi:N-acetylglucosaminyldiphosphoundecaprenol N-acetyl-beta-D-mannosaminyltransferase
LTLAEMTPDIVGQRGSSQSADILGVHVSAINMEQTLAIIDTWIEQKVARYICATSVFNVMASYDNPYLRHVHNTAGLAVPDGMPMVWISRLQGYRQVERVYGPDLMLALCGHSLSRRYRHFFLGGAPRVSDLLVGRLRELFPGLETVGSYSPPYRSLTQQEDEHVVNTINQAAPDIVWVGLGCPKQEQWMYEHVKRLRPCVLIGVGAAFDFHAGVKRQAPRWAQRSGLEMIFRVLTEPRRLWPRFIQNHPRFVVLVLLDCLGLLSVRDRNRDEPTIRPD